MKKLIHKILNYWWEKTISEEFDYPDDSRDFEEKYKKFDVLFDSKYEEELNNIAKKILTKTMSATVVEVDSFGTTWIKLNDNTIRCLLADWGLLHKFYKKVTRLSYLKGKKSSAPYS